MEHSLEPVTPVQTPRSRALPRTGKRIGLAIGLALAALLLWRFLPDRRPQVSPSGSAETSQEAKPPVTVSLLTVAPTRTPQWLDVTGTVQAELEALIASKVMGRVQSVLVKEGDRVRQGQPLILLDARDLDAAIAQANANLKAAGVGYDNARVAARMEVSLSAARIAEAQAKVTQSQAALQAATARRELVQAGPRQQEREQASLAVAQAKSNLTLSESNLRRMAALYRDGAISAQQYDQYRSQYEVARSQFETAQQSKSLVDEGSRAEDIRAAQQAVYQAQAAVQEARAGLRSAQASALQADVRKQEIQGAQAQIGQSQASLQLARVTRDYAHLAAPFDGIVTKRLADPGVMASPGVPLLKLQGGTLRLEAVVPESVLVSIRKGQTVPSRFDALRGKALAGKVVEIAAQGDTSSHTFVVKLELPARSGAASGMFGRARFTTGTEEQLLVPALAVFEREGLHYLYVVDTENIARLRMVTVGEPVGEQISVLSGLNPGERIVRSGRERVTDGGRISGESR